MTFTDTHSHLRCANITSTDLLAKQSDEGKSPPKQGDTGGFVSCHRWYCRHREKRARAPNCGHSGLLRCKTHNYVKAKELVLANWCACDLATTFPSHQTAKYKQKVSKTEFLMIILSIVCPRPWNATVHGARGARDEGRRQLMGPRTEIDAALHPRPLPRTWTHYAYAMYTLAPVLTIRVLIKYNLMFFHAVLTQNASIRWHLGSSGTWIVRQTWNNIGKFN